jgi:hypothetical protein
VLKKHFPQICHHLLILPPNSTLDSGDLYGDRVSFPFYCYFAFILSNSLKNQHLGIFPFPRLIDTQLDGLIYWTVGSNGIIQVCSALVGWPGDVPSIERLDDGPIPESSPVVDVPRRGLDHRTDNPSRTTPLTFSIFIPTPRFVHLLLLLTLISFASVLIGARVRMQSHVSISPTFCMYKGVSPPVEWDELLFLLFLRSL